MSNDAHGQVGRNLRISMARRLHYAVFDEKRNEYAKISEIMAARPTTGVMRLPCFNTNSRAERAEPLADVALRGEPGPTKCSCVHA